jgi:hypothetical protein
LSHAGAKVALGELLFRHFLALLLATLLPGGLILLIIAAVAISDSIFDSLQPGIIVSSSFPICTGKFI